MSFSLSGITSGARFLLSSSRLPSYSYLVFGLFFHYNFFHFPLCTVSLCFVSCSSSRVIGISWRTTKNKFTLVYRFDAGIGTVQRFTISHGSATQLPRHDQTTTSKTVALDGREPWQQQQRVRFVFCIFANYLILRLKWYQCVNCFNWLNYFHFTFVLIQSFTVSVEDVINLTQVANSPQYFFFTC